MGVNNSVYGRRPFENALGDRIRDLREKRGESQADMAAALNLSQRATIEQWEKGTRFIKAGQLAEIAAHFHVSTDYLLGVTRVQAQDMKLRAACEYTGLSENAVLSLVNIRLIDEKKRAEDGISINDTISQMLSDGAFYALVMQIQALHEAYKVFQSEEFIAPDEEKRELAAAEANRIMGFPVNIITGKERLELFKNNISRNSVHIAEKIVESMLKEDDATKEKAIEMLRNGGDT